MGAIRQSRLHRRRGFSLLELSIVIAIISVVAVMGLEMAAAFLSRTAYQNTQDAANTVDAALVKYRTVYGRLPCPARLNLPITDVNYGKEDCTAHTDITTVNFASPNDTVAEMPGGISSINMTDGGSGYVENPVNSSAFTVTITDTTTITAGPAQATAHIDSNGTIQYISFDSANNDTPGYGFKTGDALNINLSAGVGGTAPTAATVTATISSIRAGALPVRDLDLPLNTELDGFGNKFMYYVSYDLADPTATAGSYRFATEGGVLQVRQGPLAEPCDSTTTTCTILQNGAAYAIISPGKDQRGAYNKRGAKLNDCIPSVQAFFQIAPDAQNCKFEAPTGSNLSISFAAVPPSAATTTPQGVIYNNLFNNGTSYPLYSDDIIVTRMKSDL